MFFVYNDPTFKSLRQKLRGAAPSSELILWRHLKQRRLLGLKFRRQYGVGRYVLDFYCPQIRLAIELDGDSHRTKHGRDYDRIRDQFLFEKGIDVLRISNEEVYGNLEQVVLLIRGRCQSILSL